MTRQHLRALTVLLLALLLAAPLSTGDKGLWLSLTASPDQVAAVVVGSAPAEHAVMVPERIGQAARTLGDQRSDRVETARALGPAGSAWTLGAGWRRFIPDAAPRYPSGEPLADRPAPRAPPA